ncbi:MAG TPA: ArsA-related P-loop ATPase, partial [Polyangiaceae bacterium]|nr:ArsA-related P-loop ATPase [Polyangiaceae bacterium]
MTTSERRAAGVRALGAPVTFVTGKGGVGKSTVAAAIALRAARQGARAALVEFDDGESGARALRGADARVEHVVVSYDAALEETVAGLLGGALVARTLLGHGAVRRLVKAMPALREFVSLERVRALVAAKTYDRVVVDLPASGHAVDWLRVPGAFERFLLGGPLGSLGRRLREELVAAGKSDLVLVTLAEPL